MAAHIPMETPALQTERCVIARFGPEDVQEAVRLFTDPQARAFLGGPIPREQAVEKLAGWTAQEDGLYFCVRLREGALLGLVQVDRYDGGAAWELSCEFLPEHWGQGYAGEALLPVMGYCGKELGLTELVAETQSKNLRSRRLLERLGFRRVRELTRFGERQSVYARGL